MSASKKSPRTQNGKAERLGRSAITGTYVLKPVGKISPVRAAEIRRAVQGVVASRKD
jgi:hypothetical protein